MFLLLAGNAAAAPGDLDTSFGQGGAVRVDLAHGGNLESADNIHGLRHAYDGSDDMAYAFGDTQEDSKTVGLVAAIDDRGDMIMSFGSGGFALVDFGDDESVLFDGALAPDGKLVVAGYARSTGGKYKAAIARLNPNGSIDPSFGTNGIVLCGSSAVNSRFYAVQVLSGGSVIAGGYLEGKSDDDFWFVKLDSQGDYDSSFSSNGKATVNFGADDVLRDLIVDETGKIYGIGGTGAFKGVEGAVCRLNSDGTLDTGFSDDGKLEVNPGGITAYLYTGRLQADGKLIVAGKSYHEDNDFLTMRLNTDGEVDISWGKAGALSVDFGGGADDIALSLGIHYEDYIVVMGYSSTAGGRYPAVARLNSSGRLDTDWAWGTGGMLVLNHTYSDADIAGGYAQTWGDLVFLGNAVDTGESDQSLFMALQRSIGDYYYINDRPGGESDQAYGLELNDDGSFFAAGRSFYHGSVAKFLSNGAVDTSFSDDGFEFYSRGDNRSFLWDIAGSAGGDIFVCGNTEEPAGEMSIEFWTTNPAVGTTSGMNRDYAENDALEFGYAVTLQPDQKPVFAGQAGDGFFLTRRLQNLDADPSFGVDGEIVADPADKTTIRDVLVRPDGKIVAAGYIREGTSYSFVFLSYTSGGKTDTTFGDNGKAVVYYGGNDFLRGAALQPDGKIVACGYYGYKVLFMRINADGSVDDTFGSGGVAAYQFTNQSIANAVTVAPDGKIIAVGKQDGKPAVWRLNTDGSLDTSFSFDGMAVYPESGELNDAALRPDGRILAAGYATEGDDDYLILQYLTEGGAGTTDYTGWWYTPEKGGTGLSVGMSADKNVIFLAWYVYNSSGEAIWYVSWAQRTPGTETFVGDVRRYVGSPLGSFSDEGDLTLSFSDAASGTLTWNMSTLRANPGSKSIAKYMPTLDTGTDDPAGINGWWADASGHPATGIFVEARGTTLYLGRYYYRDDNTPVWEVMGGFLDPGGFTPGSGSYTATVMEISGGQAIHGDYTPPQLPPSGRTGTLTFNPAGDAMTFTCGSDVYTLSPYSITMP